MARRYGRRKQRKKKAKSLYKRGYKVSVGKLLSKKIDTALEKRCVEIAQKEVARDRQYFKPQTQIKDGNFDWSAAGPLLRVPTASFFSVNAGVLHTTRLSDFGNWLDNNLNSADGDVVRHNYVRCKAMMNRLTFRSQSAAGCNIYMWIVSVSGAQDLAASGLTVPTGDMFPFIGNGLFAHVNKSAKEQIPYKYRIHAKKRVWIPPAIQYQSGVTRRDNQAPDLPVLHTEPTDTTSLNLYFKGRGKKFLVRDGDARPKTQDFYLCITADNVFHMLGSISQTIYLDKPSDTAMILQVSGE